MNYPIEHGRQYHAYRSGSMLEPLTDIPQFELMLSPGYSRPNDEVSAASAARSGGFARREPGTNEWAALLLLVV